MSGPRPSSIVAAALLAATVAVGIVASAPAASSSTVVSATVPSATSIDALACRTSTLDVTDFGIVQPGAAVATGVDCEVDFGSSNDTAMLRVAQDDGIGRAMWARATGTLDPAYGDGGDGIHTRNLTGIGDVARDVSVAGNGRVVIAGDTTGNMLVGSYLASGMPDNSFSGNGFNDFDWGGAGAEQANAALATGDGGAFIVGDDATTLSGGSTQDGLLLKFGPNGNLVGGFATGGVLGVATSAGSDTAVDVDWSPDGQVLAIGTVQNATSDLYIARAHVTTGQLDLSFGVGGIRTVDVGVATSDSGRKLAVDRRSGRILVAGTSAGTVAVVAIDDAGDVDTGWGTNGITTINVGTAETVSGFGIDDLGRAYVAGDVDAAGPEDAYVLRLDDGGLLDGSFGSGGIAKNLTAADESVTGLQVDGDGGTVVVGNIAGAPFLLSFTPTGQVDRDFGSDGVHAPAIFGTGSSTVRGVVRGADGGLVVAGEFTPTASTWGSEVAVARLAMPTVPDHASGVSDWTAGTAMFGTCLRAVGGDASTDGTTWTAGGACAATNADPWRAVPVTTGAVGAKVAHTDVAGESGTAMLRFGLRTASNQEPGVYLAPITFEVVAPSA